MAEEQAGSAEPGSRPESRPIRVDFSWSPQPADWRAAVRAVVPMYRWAQWFAAVLAVFGVVLVVLGDVLPGLYGLLAAAVIAVLPALRVRASFQRHPLASKTVTATADDHSVRMTVDDLARSDLAWTELPAWLETAQGIVLRTGPDRGSAIYPVPHRAFAAPDDEQRFRALLQRHIGPASR